MNRRHIHLAGDLPASDVATPAPGFDQIELRTMLAAEQARSEASERRSVDLQLRLDAAEQRSARLESELQQAHARIADLSQLLTAAQNVPPPLPPEPLAFEGYVSARDGDGRIKKFELLPKSQL